jgi:superfamily II DNA or RNA helicase
MIKLRPYQTEARDAVLDHWQRGILNVLLAMATGTGKTETFLAILAEARKKTPGFRALIIAHREELISQPTERIAKHWQHALPIPGIVMASQNDNRAEIVVATVQTLAGRRKDKDGPIHMTRLKELVRNGRFTHLVIDESHHATAPTYRRVTRFLRLANPDLLHLGVTATPKRTDEDGLKKVYDAVAYKVTIKDAIEKIKSLSPFVGMGFTLPVSLKGVRTIAGDYSEGALDRLLSADNVEQVIIEKWKEHALLPDGSYRPTMAFCAGVMQAERLALAFRNAGIPAGFASGNTPKKERRAILRDFKQGKTRVLCNCALWTEGMDAPSISCVIMARPTKSDLVYIQAIGRGLRLFPGKDHCLIMDFAPSDGRDLVMSGDLLGVPKAQRKVEERAKEEDTVLDIFGLLSKKRGIDADPDAVQVAVLDYFSRHTPLRWTHDGRVASATIAEKTALAIVFPQEERVAKADELREAGQWSSKFDSIYEQISGYQVYAVRGQAIELLGTEADWSDALSIAEDFADANMDQKLAMKSAKWRNDPPSLAQRNFAKRLGVWQQGMSKGQVGQAITHGLALEALKKNRVINGH